MNKNPEGEKYRFEPWERIGNVDDFPIPSPEMLNFAKEQDLLSIKGLALHVVTSLVVADTIINAIERANSKLPTDKKFDINGDVTLETMVSYHSARPLAVLGKKGLASDAVNKFMEQNDDIAFAEVVAVKENIPLSVVQSIGNLDNRKGFPQNTIGPSNPNRPETIDWTTVITQVAGWSVTEGTIQPLDKRFDDLMKRHIGNPDSTKNITIEGYENLGRWGKDRIVDISRHIGISHENFFEWLRESIVRGSEKGQNESDNLIRELFKKEPKRQEFLPISHAYKYLARSILDINEGDKNDPRKRHLERILLRPERFLHLCKMYGLVEVSNDKKFKTND